MNQNYRRRPDSDRRGFARGGRRRGDRTQAITHVTPKPVVLIADAYRDGREMLAEYLAFYGFPTTQAASGREALQKAGACHVAVLELVMPDISGLELVSALTHAPASSHVCVIVHSASVTATIRHNLRAAGIRTFIPKPTEPALVLSQILHACSHLAPFGLDVRQADHG
jgi:CheY-like chemotaxis protein